MISFQARPDILPTPPFSGFNFYNNKENSKNVLSFRPRSRWLLLRSWAASSRRFGRPKRSISRISCIQYSLANLCNVIVKSFADVLDDHVRGVPTGNISTPTAKLQNTSGKNKQNPLLPQPSPLQNRLKALLCSLSCRTRAPIFENSLSSLQKDRKGSLQD
jgi:hypothetical protein